MFEGNLQDAGFAEAIENAALQPIQWDALVAQLAAARDLRSVYARRKSASGGNFARFSAAQSAILNESAPGVNRNTSADGKDSGGNVPAAADDADPGDREL
ncbi:hypothetical protein [Pontixanthobacter aquaemixtae]|uniref:Uncharacterized protein n=1 Tax=Pontixanthobacter aquaemixtae TaxID=1958940 RepID=A0A844ZTR0_9SPHN|nr:hypothetical protein [Pontixanthobacter aquaemixtae]MXO91333.1 hypothetical protein [Pontixanthobacter aquaemixtae]